MNILEPSVLFQNASLMLQSVSDLSIISNNLQDWLHTVKNILTHPCCTHHFYFFIGSNGCVHAHITQRTKSKTQQVAITLCMLTSPKQQNQRHNRLPLHCACSHHPENKIKDTAGGHYTVHAHITQTTKSKTQQVAITLCMLTSPREQNQRHNRWPLHCACSHHPNNKIKDTTGGHYTVHAHITQTTKSKTQQVAVTLSVALGDISCSQSC